MRLRVNKLLFVSIFLWLYCFVAVSQTETIHIKTWVKKDEILLRWAPFTKEIFDIAYKSGYKIERKDNLGNTVVLMESVKPYSKDDTIWKKLFKQSERAMVVYGALYGNSSLAKDQKLKKDQGN